MYKKYFIALFFVAVCAFLFPIVTLAFGQDSQPDNQQNGVHGTVINSVTREPLGRALVFSPDNRFATMTDSEGHFEFVLPAASATYPSPDRAIMDLHGTGPDSLMARKPGFLEEHSQVSTVTSAGKELTIPLIPEALIVGHVTLPSSEDSDRIQVNLYRRQVQEGRARWIASGVATTNSNGEFRFAELAAGSYKLLTGELLDRDPLTFDPRGQLYGYPPVYFPDAGNFVAAETIHVSAGQTFQANFRLARHAYYPVKVTLGIAQPVGMNIKIYAQGRGPGYSLGYNDQAQAITGTLPDGNYTVEARSYGPTLATGFVNITVKGGPLEGPQMILAPSGTIDVRVKEEFTSPDNNAAPEVFIRNGAPVQPPGPRRYLNIRLEPADDFGLQQGAYLRNPDPARPDDEALVLENVRPGRYWVKIDSSRGFASEVSYGGVNLMHEPLEIGAGGGNAPIEITVRDDGAEVDGTVEGIAAAVEQAGSAGLSRPPGFSAHAYLIPTADGDGDFREGWVTQDGKFNIQQVPPGAYLALAFDRPQQDLEYRNPEAMREYESKGQVIRLVAGQKEQLRLQVISTSE